jgi:hypothetical protein
VKSAKWAKKVVPTPAVVPIVVRATAGASRSKGATEGAKAAATAQKHRIPTLCLLTEASLAESQESSSHEQPPRASPPEVVTRPEHESSLQITTTTGAGRCSILDAIAGIFVG